MDEFDEIKAHLRKNKKVIRVFLIILFGITFFIVLPILFFSSYCVVDAGHTGVKVTLGSVSDDVLSEGFHTKKPFVTKVIQIDNRVMKYQLRLPALRSLMQLKREYILIIAWLSLCLHVHLSDPAVHGQMPHRSLTERDPVQDMLSFQ